MEIGTRHLIYFSRDPSAELQRCFETGPGRAQARHGPPRRDGSRAARGEAFHNGSTAMAMARRKAFARIEPRSRGR
ncbi:hypothetical protein PPH41_43865, partial [Burkholderia gladioli]|nr:hypothetical protein [Burkholderia gladioli]